MQVVADWRTKAVRPGEKKRGPQNALKDRNRPSGHDFFFENLERLHTATSGDQKRGSIKNDKPVVI